MSKENLLAEMKKGIEEEISIRGTKILVKTPRLQDYNIVFEFYRDMESGKDIDFGELAKIVIECAFNPETKEQMFHKGDLKALQEDRLGVVQLLVEKMTELMGKEQLIDIEDAKKN